MRVFYYQGVMSRDSQQTLVIDINIDINVDINIDT